MSNNRSSYIRTTILAAGVLVFALASIAWRLKARSSPKPHLLVTWLRGFTVASLGLVCALAGLLLVGSIICLRRDSRENRGLPYVLRRPREWYGGFIFRGLRASMSALRGLRHKGSGHLMLRPGELVRIRSLNEILTTVDDKGRREALPFTPEMVSYCGCQARVFRRVDKVFDWILSCELRRMQGTVILEGMRCDGRYHGGCQAGCQMLWKEEWLERINTQQRGSPPQSICLQSHLDLYHFTQRVDATTSEQRFVCQMTELPEATSPISRKERFILFEDLKNGNLRPSVFLLGITIQLFNFVQRRCNGAVFPYRVPIEETTTPHTVLNLQPGDVVRVKSKHKIEATLNAEYKNRGLWFDPEMARYCGGVYRVLARVSRQIEEKTGKMINIKLPCIILEGVTASGEYHAYSSLDELIYWHEIWLERVQAEPSQTNPMRAQGSRTRSRVRTQRPGDRIVSRFTFDRDLGY